MTINDLKNELGLTNAYIAEFFGFKNSLAYRNSSAKSRYEAGLCSFYAFVKSKHEEEKENETDKPVNVD